HVPLRGSRSVCPKARFRALHEQTEPDRSGTSGSASVRLGEPDPFESSARERRFGSHWQPIGVFRVTAGCQLVVLSLSTRPVDTWLTVNWCHPGCQLDCQPV